MTAQNEITRAGTGSSAVNARFRWLSEHRLLAFVLLTYGISWSLLIGGFVGTQAGLLNPDGQVVSPSAHADATGGRWPYRL